jgi:hypothetical protein
MTRKLLLAILAVSFLVGAWGGAAAGGDLGYRVRSWDEDITVKTQPGPPSSARVAGDAVIGRPLGLATTIAGTGVFILTLPFSICGGKVDESAWGLVGKPAGWTFCRPMGRPEPKYLEKGIFPY